MDVELWEKFWKIISPPVVHLLLPMTSPRALFVPVHCPSRPVDWSLSLSVPPPSILLIRRVTHPDQVAYYLLSFGSFILLLLLLVHRSCETPTHQEGSSLPLDPQRSTPWGIVCRLSLVLVSPSSAVAGPRGLFGQPEPKLDYFKSSSRRVKIVAT